MAKLLALLLTFELKFELTVEFDTELYMSGVELERPLDVKLFRVDSVAFSDRKFTVSLLFPLLRESRRSSGNKPSDTASSMHGSSPLMSAFDSVLIGF